MGRKSRLKRERANAKSDDDDAIDRPSSAASAASEVGALRAAESRPVPSPIVRKSRAVGARVARVAVDDTTWAAFRELCGSTPASIRLGELVAAEVENARNPAPEPDAIAAVNAIRAYADEIDAFVRGAVTRP